MDSIGDRHAISSALHDQLVLAMASSRLHQRLHDPEKILAGAAVDKLMEHLTASGFIVIGGANTLADSWPGPGSPDGLQS